MTIPFSKVEYVALWLILVLTSIQFYSVRLFEASISLVFLLSLPFLLYLLAPRIWMSKKPASLVFLLVIFLFLSLAWSPDKVLGFRRILYYLQYIALFCGFYLFMGKVKATNFLMNSFLSVLILQFILVIVFRISPELEFKFLTSQLGSLVFGRSFIDRLVGGEIFPNIIDDAKSGGFFQNANVAAGYMGISTLTIVAFKLIEKKRNTIIFVLILGLIAILCTGSKAGLFFSYLFISVIVLGYRYIYNKSLAPFIFSALLLFLVFIVIIINNKDLLISYFSSGASRFLLWKFGIDEFQHNMLFGHGFGGWSIKLEKSFPQFFGFRIAPPPHNNLMIIWSESGVLPLIISIIIIVTIISMLMGVFRNLNYSIRLRKFSLLVLCSYLWVFFHGAITNWMLVGFDHVIPVLSFSLAYWHRQVENEVL